jgi:ribosomal protein S18 acetylase RimI-like enzyme
MPPATEANIRTCKKSDLPVVRAYHQELHAELGDEPSEDDIESGLSEYTLIAEIDGEPAGYLLGRLQSSEFVHTEVAQSAFQDEDYLEVCEVYVEPRLRNRGIGTALIRAVLKRARGNDLQRSMVCSGKSDHARAAAFYERCGFRVARVYLVQ